MGDQTGIEWTDATWNPVRGCSRVSPGCGGPRKAGGCYAEKIAARFSGPGQPFEGFARMVNGEARWTGKLALVEDMLELPLRWKRPRRIFVNSMSDLGHENLPYEAIDRVFSVMARAHHHEFQVLSKRPSRMRSYLTDDPASAARVSKITPSTLIQWPLKNVLIGASAEDQERADERREPMRAIAAAGWKTFVSYEPALGPVNWRGWEFLAWLISGGESGPRSRPSHPDWHRAARDFCAAHGIAYFFKQWGAWITPAAIPLDEEATFEPAWMHDDGTVSFEKPTPVAGEAHRWIECARGSKKACGNMLDGRRHLEFPVRP